MTDMAKIIVRKNALPTLKESIEILSAINVLKIKLTALDDIIYEH